MCATLKSKTNLPMGIMKCIISYRKSQSYFGESTWLLSYILCQMISSFCFLKKLNTIYFDFILMYVKHNVHNYVCNSFWQKRPQLCYLKPQGYGSFLLQLASVQKKIFKIKQNIILTHLNTSARQHTSRHMLAHLSRKKIQWRHQDEWSQMSNKVDIKHYLFCKIQMSVFSLTLL